MVWLFGGEKSFRYGRLPACDGRTDRQTDGQSGERTSCVGIVRAMYAVTTIFVVFVVFNFVRCPCNVFDMIVST